MIYIAPCIDFIASAPARIAESVSKFIFADSIAKTCVSSVILDWDIFWVCCSYCFFLFRAVNAT